MVDEIKILWSSRHPLDLNAWEDLIKYFGGDRSIQMCREEILWPSELEECLKLAEKLGRKYDILTGVWPAQAIEAFKYVFIGRVLAPVSEPELEPDTGKVRAFRFVRWAIVA